MLTAILALLVISVAIFILVAAMQPADFRVTRSITISAPAPTVFAQVNELGKWAAWNPWQQKDPAMQLTFAGPPSGAGASYAWAGNKDVGQGRLTITESHPHDLVRLRLEFFKPFAATNAAEFTFSAEGNQTAVTWTMTGKNNLFAKALHLVMNMDKMVGGEFERGLAAMNTVAETAAGSR
ncbi:MAG: SRPBCC family protein [Betaproteobacteria bacterium]|jgi:hypothetical protein